MYKPTTYILLYAQAEFMKKKCLIWAAAPELENTYFCCYYYFNLNFRAKNQQVILDSILVIVTICPKSIDVSCLIGLDAVIVKSPKLRAFEKVGAT